MSILMVKTPHGKLRRVELSKNQPLTIGSHSTSDVQITEPGTELIEARISWGKKRFEVTSATSNGFEINGETKLSADLKPGDVLNFGNTQLIFTTEDLWEESLAGLTDFEDELEIGLAPISEEIAAIETESFEDESIPAPSIQKPSRKAATKSETSPSDTVPIADGDRDSGEEEPSRGVPMLRRVSHTSRTESGEPSLAVDEEAPPRVDDTSALEKIRESLHASRQRPGEKEILRSPLVMGLSIGSFFLLAGAVILWSVIGREKADRKLEQARQQAEQRKFQSAIENYQQYLLEFPGDADVETAKRELSITQVRSKIDIGVPDWEAGLSELRTLVDRHRDDEDFERLHGNISEFAEQIAKGVCQKAGREGDRKLFDLSDQALGFVKRYTRDEDRSEQIVAEIQALRRDAEARILKRDVFHEAFAAMESALKQSKPLEVLDARLELMRRYADAETDSQVVTFLQKALDLEQSLIQQRREEKEPAELPPARSAPLTTLTATSRISRNELPSGRPVYVHAADALFGVDTATGEPIWRHVTGWNLPFFPIEVELEEQALLLFAERDQELQLLSRQTGELIWRQSFPERAVGTPLVDGTQAFLATDAGLLLQIDLATGKRLGGLSFSQPLATGPLLLPDTHHALLIGARELAYLVELNPPAIVDVLYFGHGPRSVATSPIRMGPLVLVAENDRADSARLRVFDTRQESPELVQTVEQRLSGQVIDAPVIRGKQLLIPSTPERVTAFTVSAEPDQPPLTQVNYYQVPNPRRTSVWLSAGPDGQVWMASSAVRRMHLTTESFEASSDLAAVGIATQPIQMLGDRLYVGRRPDDGQCVQFSRLDRNDLSGAWRTTVGDRILQAELNSSGELITLHDSGAVFRLQKDSLNEKPFSSTVNANVELPEFSGSDRFSTRFSDGRFAMTWGGAEPKLNVIRSTGQIEREYELTDNPQAPPVNLDAGIVVAFPGRLHLVSNSRSGAEDFLLPVVEGGHSEWKSLTRLDGSHLLCVEDSGLLRRIEFRTEPVPHLAEAGRLEPKTPFVLPPLLTGDDRFVVFTEGRELLEVAADSLQILSSRTLDSLPVGAWKSGDSVLLQLQNDTLVCLEDRDELNERWNVALSRQTVAGQPLARQDTIVVPLAPQGVWVLKQESGEIVGKVKTPGTCSGDPMLIDGQVVIPLADGSLYLLPEPAEAGDEL